MVLCRAERENTVARATQAFSTRKLARCAAASPVSTRQRFRAQGVTFLKTLVSDYQILSPVSTFACTLGQQSSQYKPMTLSGPFVMRFLPYSILSTPDVDLF
jgi:hypothetical protein